MNCRVGGDAWSGPAVDLSSVGADGETVVAAVRTVGPVAPGGAVAAVEVDCPDPGPLHERIGLLRSGMSLRVRTALALAGRSREMTTPHDQALADARDALAALTGAHDGDRATNDDGGSAEAARRRLAEADADVDRLRERVAAVRGRLAERREGGEDATALESELADAVRELSEAETERVAAREALARVRDRARADRARRDRRLELQDRVANLERAARSHLVAALRGEFAAAVADAPGGRSVDDPFEAGAVTAALAIGRVADLDAPVVDATRRFDSAVAARRWLDGQVIRV